MKKSHVKAALALGALLVISIIAIMLFFVNLPVENRTILTSIISAIGGWLGASYKSYFTKSNDEEDVDDGESE